MRRGALIFDRLSSVSKLVFLSHLLSATRPTHLAVLEEVAEAVACLATCPSGVESSVGLELSLADEATPLLPNMVTIQTWIAKRCLRKKSPREMQACAFGSRG